MQSILRDRFPELYALYVRRSRERQRRERMARVAAVLADPTPPQPVDDEAVLRQLMARPFPTPKPYFYDTLSLWLRAAERIARLAALGLLTERPLRILEVCGGDGMVSHTLGNLGHDVVMVDGRDWRTERARHIPFNVVNVDQGLPFDAAQFDLVVSYNAFEHVSAPKTVLGEMIRVCQPGGRVMLNFGPLYASPFGLHAWSLNIPWPQYLLSPRLLDIALRSRELNDLGSVLTEVQPTNGWLLGQYRALWTTSGSKIDHMTEDEDHRFLDLVLEFPAAFRGRQLCIDDLIKNSIEIVFARQAC